MSRWTAESLHVGAIGFTQSTRTTAISRIPGAGPVRDLFDVISAMLPNDCTDCEKTIVREEHIVDATEEVIEFLHGLGIELDR
jgi:hypothetical protein